MNSLDIWAAAGKPACDPWCTREAALEMGHGEAVLLQIYLDPGVQHYSDWGGGWADSADTPGHWRHPVASSCPTRAEGRAGWAADPPPHTHTLQLVINTTDKNVELSVIVHVTFVPDPQICMKKHLWYQTSLLILKVSVCDVDVVDFFFQTDDIEICLVPFFFIWDTHSALEKLSVFELCEVIPEVSLLFTTALWMNNLVFRLDMYYP